MLKSLSIASDGYLADKSTLAVSVNGLLIFTDIPIVVGGGGAAPPPPKKLDNSKKNRLSNLAVEDKEIFILVQTFVKCL
jgi:hypothetical protein